MALLGFLSKISLRWKTLSQEYKNEGEVGVLDRAFRKAEYICLSLEGMDTSTLEIVDSKLIDTLELFVESCESTLYSSIANSFLSTLKQYKEAKGKEAEKEGEPETSKKSGRVAYTISEVDYAEIKPIIVKWGDAQRFYQAEYFNFREEVENTPKIFLDVLREIEELVQKEEKERRIDVVKKRVSLFIERVTASKEILLSSNFGFMSPFDFEEFIAKLFNKLGYETRTTSKTGDYGVDVIAQNSFEKVAIQCKKYHEGNNVGNQTVQMLLGSMQLQGLKADRGIIVTTSSFTRQAYKQAEGNNIELWDKDVLHKAVREHLIGL